MERTICRLRRVVLTRREIVSQIVMKLREDQRQAVGKVSAERTRLEARLTGIRRRMDAAYSDKLDGKISEDFWERKMRDWQIEEQQVKMAIQALSNAEAGDGALDAERIFELANKAYSLYVSQNPSCTHDKSGRLTRPCNSSPFGFGVPEINRFAVSSRLRSFLIDSANLGPAAISEDQIRSSSSKTWS
jgi:hypothetical protein